MAILYVGAALGAGKSGLTVGYRVLDAAGVVVIAFTTTGVVETGVPGSYTVNGGIDVSAQTAGRVVFGESGDDLAELWFGPPDVSSGGATPEEINDFLVAEHGDGPWGGASGSGSVAYDYVVLDPDDNPIPDVFVYVTAEGSGLVLATGHTDETGTMTFFLDPGIYDFYSRKGGYNFDNPDTETVA